MERSCIYVVSHNPKNVAISDAIHSVIHVGQSSSNGNIGNDSTGDSISSLNPYFCELTALYWVWKNVDLSEFRWVGFCHYRRYFSGSSVVSTFLKKPISYNEVNRMLKNVDVILPFASHFPAGLKSQYVSNHPREDVEELIVILKSNCGDRNQIDQIWDRPCQASMYNMFIMKTELFQRYCRWLFPILFELHNLIDYRGRSTSELRAIGYLGERLLNVFLWLDPSQKSIQIPVIRTDRSNLQNSRARFLGMT